ncbi:MAG: rod shape-determining protein MreC [Patescibacteria group bacterium]|nr:rod shape-determining protein MreC [Patescibacteria group bacterium]MBU1877262.1 rod shape-determining protein MreC [Patescibacteria group bacterium]
MKLTPKIKIIITVFLFFLALITLNFFPFSKKIKTFFYSVSQPIQCVFNEAGDSVSSFWEMIFKIQLLGEDNRLLRLNILNLLADNSKLKDLEKENQDLRDALGLEMEKEFDLTLVKIIGKDIGQDSIMINKGLEDNLSNGLVVITGQKVLVGKISEVYDHFSRVILLSSKDNSLDVQIQNKDIDGLARGDGSLNLLLDLVPKEKEINEKDVVITHYLSKKYPQGLLVGQIKTIKKQDAEPFQIAEIEPFFDIGTTETLFVINNF